MTVARQSALDPIEQGGGDGGDADGGEGAWARLKQLCLAIEAAIGRLELGLAGRGALGGHAEDPQGNELHAQPADSLRLHFAR